MNAPSNAMEVFKLLEKSNCRECGEKTCLAFAGAVFTGRKRLQECPRLGPEIQAQFRLSEDRSEHDESGEPGRDPLLDEYVSGLLQRITLCDYQEVAQRTSVKLKGSLLQVPVLGKNFGVQKDGSFVTDLHTIPWVVIPVLEYLLDCKGVQPAGNWVSFRELNGGREKYALFRKRGEDVLKTLGDRFPAFFEEVVSMFSGKQVEKQFASDISVVLYPLPLVPMMICYWKPEDGMQSSLNLFFDRSLEHNLNVDSAFFLGTGLASMLDKFARVHGF